ncbi:MAG: C10 family peptidase [Bacteroidaceae bacterium]|nr:C10 family peptidase [Bacteroidaceae bacterium]
MMRRTIILILSLAMTMTGKAGDVTPEQALQQAQAFVENVGNVKSRRAVSASSLRMEGRVDGLYVFNMEENGGYVIVSDDDRTTPVLGYADSGHLDLDNMPENMKAWLQGYANEIAWIRTNNIQPAVNAASRRASVVKKPVAPLLRSQWSQDFPFNYLCPEYMPGVQADAGCVALAMAQCMYATEMRVGSTTTYTTAEIPAYKTGTRGFSIDGIPAGTPINWSKMIGNFSGDYTGEQAMAVAELMYYCGVAVEMDYAMVDNGNSGAYSSNVPDALVNYFDYSPTAKHLIRSNYSYQDWIDMMYNELSQGRPIVYGGSTETVFGHGFVCDGYATEDYFHIDWGWSGDKNGYFKLSVLDPYSELGTSNIPSAFGADQDAVIGIQKKGETGTVLEIPPHVVNLSGKFKSCSDYPTQGQNVDVFVEVQNNSNDEYDGSFYLYAYYGQTEESVYSKRVVIPAKESRVCQLSFVPEHSGEYILGLYYVKDEVKSLLAASPVFDVADGIELPTTANVELGHTLTIENVTALYDAEKNDYDIYGNTFHGKLTVTNPDPTTNFRGHYICSMKRTKPAAKEVFAFFREIVIPSGGSFDIPIDFTGMAHKDRYSLTITYFTENGWHSQEEIALFYKQPTIVTTMPDGTEIDDIPQLLDPEGTYTVPAQAVSVDLRGTGITTLNTEGCTPNTLYLFNTTDEVPAGLTNIVRFDTSSRQYTADDIRLTDGYSFASPVDLTASNITFTYHPDRWADEKGGWNTLIVPFNVTSVTADGQPIDWFRSSSDEGKQFWLKEFSGDDPDIVYFDDVASSMTANTPYLIALPGNHWGADYDLSKQTIKFIGSGEIQKSTSETLTASSYIYMGNTAQNNIENIYTLNAAGTQFELSNGNAPFRAYFKPITFAPRITALSISSNKLSVPVREVENNEPSTDIWYTIDGRRLSGKPATKGIYIVDGKKVVIK